MPDLGVLDPPADLVALCDEWGRAARTEIDTVKKAIAVAAHAECLAMIRRARNGAAR